MKKVTRLKNQLFHKLQIILSLISKKINLIHWAMDITIIINSTYLHQYYIFSHLLNPFFTMVTFYSIPIIFFSVVPQQYHG